MYEQQIDGIEKELDELEEAMNQEGADLEALEKEAAALKQQLEEFAKKQAEWKEEQVKWEQWQKEQQDNYNKAHKSLDSTIRDTKAQSNSMFLIGACLIGYALITRKKK